MRLRVNVNKNITFKRKFNTRTRPIVSPGGNIVSLYKTEPRINKRELFK